MSDILARWKKLSPRVNELRIQVPVDILKFWNSDKSCFYRSTAELKLDRPYYPTATYRCIEALATIGGTSVQSYLDEFANYLSSNPSLALESGLDKENIFTRSHLIQAFTRVAGVLTSPDHESHIDALEKHLCDNHGAGFADEPPHAFLTYHALVALQAGRPSAITDARFARVWDELEGRLFRIIAMHESGATVHADVVELAFCVAALTLHLPIETPVLHKALEIICAHQGADGAWPIGRPLRYSGQGSVHVPSIEVALALADLAHRLGTEAPNRLIDTLFSVADFLLQSRRTVGNYRGWANDRARRDNLVESWVNAVAAMFLDRLIRTASRYASNLFVERYGGERPADITVPWAKIDETDTDRPIKQFIYDRIVRPILNAGEDGLPQQDSCSLILYGPPGTSKTTLVKGIAKELKWPIITLTPGSFVERGLEFIETRAREVFDDLCHMEQVVILFDECDELFLKRPDEPSNASTRTIASLVTASMLPRLQRLHDLHRCVFVLGTNLYDSLDDAIRRPGRFDYRVSVGPPDDKARGAILARELPASLSTSIKTLVMATKRFTYTELKRIARNITLKPIINEDIALQCIEAAQVGLSITEGRYKEFLEREQPRSDHRTQ